MSTEGEARTSELQGPEPKAERTYADRFAPVDYLASIVGEVLQPIAAMVADAQAALHWLDHPAPDVDEAREALSCIIRAGAWAGALLDRTRGEKEAPPEGPCGDQCGSSRGV